MGRLLVTRASVGIALAQGSLAHATTALLEHEAPRAPAPMGVTHFWYKLARVAYAIEFSGAVVCGFIFRRSLRMRWRFGGLIAKDLLRVFRCGILNGPRSGAQAETTDGGC